MAREVSTPLRATRSASREAFTRPTSKASTRHRPRHDETQEEIIVHQSNSPAEIPLALVQEEDDSVHAPTIDIHADVNDIDRNAIGQSVASYAPPTSQHSVITGYTTHTQDDLSNMDVETILGALEDLDHTANSIITEVASIELDIDDLKVNAQQLLDSRSALRRKLSKRIGAFQNYQSSFAEQRIIDPEHVLRFLLQLPPQVELRSSIWRPDDILYKANITNVLVLIIQAQTLEDRMDTLGALDSQFPGLALKSLHADKDFAGLVGQSEQIDAAFNFALELRTQMFIHALESLETEHTPLALLELVFLSDESTNRIVVSDGHEKYPLRVWKPSLFDTSRTDLWTAVAERFKNLRNLIAVSPDHAAILSNVREEHPWIKLCVGVLYFVQRRGHELSTLIKHRGGAATITKALTDEVNRVDDNTDPLLTDTAPKQSNLASTQNIRRLRELQNRPRSSNVGAEVASETTPAATTRRNQDYFIPALAEDDERQEPTASGSPLFVRGHPREAASPLDRLRAAHAQANKENNRARFIDEQASARRVDFDESQNGPTSHGPTRSSAVPVSSNSTSNLKRPFVDDSWEPTQDAFETDKRDHSPHRRAPQARMTAASPPRAVESRGPGAASPPQAHVPTRNVRQNPGQSFPSPPSVTLNANGVPSLTPYDTYQQSKVLSRHVTATETKAARARTAWSEQEVGALIEYMETFGPSYAKIKRFDTETNKILDLRTGEDIRFKARNMLVEFKKGGIEPLAGFEQVALSKKEIDLLARYGVNHEQATIRRHAPTSS